MEFSVLQLTPADLLKRSDGDKNDSLSGAYVVRKIWQQPRLVGESRVLHMTITGFTLFDTASLTDREVNVEELQSAVDAGLLTPFYPQTVRLVRGLTPKDYHQNKWMNH